MGNFNAIALSDADTLWLADGFDHQKYWLPSAFLKRVTLVSIPLQAA
jgi:hypothetical protein